MQLRLVSLAAFCFFCYFLKSATVSFIMSDMLSGCDFASIAALFRLISPHLRQRWIMTKPFLGSGTACIGSSSPRQGFALSPGFISTWSDHRQCGQWFLDVYPRGKTCFPQWTHTKELSFFVNLFCSIIAVPPQARQGMLQKQRPLSLEC